MAEKEKRKLEPRPIGAPPTDIDYRDLEYLMTLWPKCEWVAGFFRCDPKTIQNHIRNKYDLTFDEFRLRYFGPTAIAVMAKLLDQVNNGSTRAIELMLDRVLQLPRNIELNHNVQGGMTVEHVGQVSPVTININFKDADNMLKEKEVTPYLEKLKDEKIDGPRDTLKLAGTI